MLIYPVINNKTEINSDYLQETIYDLLNITFQIPPSYSYNIFRVTKEYIARPDLISLDAYGDTMFGDVICKLNGISNPFELNEGMNIVLPAPDSIMDFTTSPDISDLDRNFMKSNSSTTDKNKNSKRKANEAIVGDTRFKIDAKSGIIIY